MQGFTTFVGQHWLLWLILVLLVLLLVAIESRGKVAGVLQVAPKDAVMLMNREQALVIDSRGADAYSNGHIVKAMNYQAENLDSVFKKIKRYQSKPVIVYGQGQQGGAAVKAAKKLQQLGFKDVQLLAGGLAAWQKAELPLVKEAS